MPLHLTSQLEQHAHRLDVLDAAAPVRDTDQQMDGIAADIDRRRRAHPYLGLFSTFSGCPGRCSITLS
jgi:hypothetical protein